MGDFNFRLACTPKRKTPALAFSGDSNERERDKRENELQRNSMSSINLTLTVDLGPQSQAGSSTHCIAVKAWGSGGDRDN